MLRYNKILNIFLFVKVWCCVQCIVKRNSKNIMIDVNRSHGFWSIYYIYTSNNVCRVINELCRIKLLIVQFQIVLKFLEFKISNESKVLFKFDSSKKNVVYKHVCKLFTNMSSKLLLIKTVHELVLTKT